MSKEFMLQNAVSNGNGAEYSEIEQTMSPKVLNLMLEWILERD